MAKEIQSQSKNNLLVPLLCFLLIAASGVGLYLLFKTDKKDVKIETVAEQPEQKEQTFEKIPQDKIIDYDRLGEDDQLQAMVQERKDQFRLNSGVDVILKADESVKVGDVVIPMKEILEKVRLRQGKIIEEGLGKTSAKEPGDAFGIYVVKPNDNLWNIHFRFLKDYFDQRNVHLTPVADKPDKRGFSSGVGKILKFSENIVYIYNVRDRKLDADLHFLYPNSEIVVFHMEEIFSLLDQINLENVDNIRFDGQNLWLPAD